MKKAGSGSESGSINQKHGSTAKCHGSATLMSTNELVVCCAECRQAGHYAASDIPLILENSWLARTLLPSKDESGRSQSQAHMAPYVHEQCEETSVGDPDPHDPHVFGPPGS
jgi:hypothetical protein